MKRTIAALCLLTATLLAFPAPRPAGAEGEGISYKVIQATYRKLTDSLERHGPNDPRSVVLMRLYVALQKRYAKKHGEPVPTDPAGIPPGGGGTTNPPGGGNPSGGTTAKILDDSWLRTLDYERLISDGDFTNSGCMTAAEIQGFLERKGSVLAKPVDGVRPSQAIYLAARSTGISPLVLLSTLQKEQSLVTAKTATRKQLDWAFGVGCYDSGNWNTKYQGFEKQVLSAAQTLRNHFDAGRKKLASSNTIPMTIDGKTVRCRNASTYALYKYTPHFAGNKLFQQVARGFYGAYGSF